MNETLRKWLESRCRAWPGGGWLIEVPVLPEQPAPAFVLPDGAVKETYIARAVRLGRSRLLSEFVLTLLAYALAIWFYAAVVLERQDEAGLWVAAVVVLLVLIASRHAWIRRESRRVRAWLDRAGAETAPEAGRVVDRGREAGWWSGWQTEVKRCRPGWMVVADATAYCAFLASFVLFSFALRPHCRRALNAWWVAEEPLWPVPDGCLNPGTAALFFLLAWLAMGPALAVRDWWRWNMGRT